MPSICRQKESEYLNKQVTDRTKRGKELRETFQSTIAISSYIRSEDRLWWLMNHGKFFIEKVNEIWKSTEGVPVQSYLRSATVFFSRIPTILTHQFADSPRSSINRHQNPATTLTTYHHYQEIPLSTCAMPPCAMNCYLKTSSQGQRHTEIKEDECRPIWHWKLPAYLESYLLVQAENILRNSTGWDIFWKRTFIAPIL